ncbi:MAG: ECF transporter S component [Aeromicrobium sp.]|uniref:ECF transporter S component n=1 Tax=Aeromicrobium sp. TaxID=1871063 RepID=UPI0039E49204
MSSASLRDLLRYRTIDLVTIATLGVAFGVVFWGWGKLYALFDIAAKLGFPPAAALMGGGWLIAGVVGGLVVRKPGAALVTELIAACVSAFMPGNEWGSSVLVSGLLEGLGAELVLAVFAYRLFGPAVAMAAGALAGVFEAVYEWGSWYADWDFDYRLAHLVLFVVSGALIAGVGGWLLVRALARAGALDAFPAGREAVTTV